jgi:anti-anti-sigma regulatory factor
MTVAERMVLPFPCPSSPRSRQSRLLQRKLRTALRGSEYPVIVDLSHCSILNSADIELLIDCAALGEGRDTPIVFVAASRVIRILLEVTRIGSLVPVFSTMEEALAYTAEKHIPDSRESQAERSIE